MIPFLFFLLSRKMSKKYVTNNKFCSSATSYAVYIDNFAAFPSGAVYHLLHQFRTFSFLFPKTFFYIRSNTKSEYCVCRVKKRPVDIDILLDYWMFLISKTTLFTILTYANEEAGEH